MGLDCLLNQLFRRRSKKTSKLRVTGLCEGNWPVTGEFPAQRASKVENDSTWWRRHAFKILNSFRWSDSIPKISSLWRSHRPFAESKISPFWWNFYHWLHRIFITFLPFSRNRGNEDHDDVIKWKHQMEKFSASMALCGGGLGWGIHRWIPITKTSDAEFDVFYLRLSKRLSDQSIRWWFETPSRSFWRHCNAVNSIEQEIYVLPLMAYTLSPVISGIDIAFTASPKYTYMPYMLLWLNLLRPRDTYICQQTNHHWFR